MTVDQHEGPDPLLGQVLDGKYRIETKLGRGGMGAVYRATHVLMEHQCAVKVLHTAQLSDPSAIPRFQREARAAARIQHPNAIAVNDFGITEANVVYLVMEYFPGKSLREIIKEAGSLSPERTAKILEKVAAALHAAHRQGIIHRDVKPDNIMIREVPGDEDEVKVLDFGIAKMVDATPGSENLTITGTIIGTPHYLSPEQCRALADIDPRSDVYSLAIVTYEMLLGRPPFTAGTPIAVAMMHLTEPPASLLDELEDLDPAAEAVVFKAMAKAREDRYGSTVEFAQEFILAVSGVESASLSSLMNGRSTSMLGNNTGPITGGSFSTDTGKTGRSVDTVAVTPKHTPAGGFSVDTGSHTGKTRTGFDASKAQTGSQRAVAAADANTGAFEPEVSAPKSGLSPLMYAAIGAVVLTIVVGIGLFVFQPGSTPEPGTPGTVDKPDPNKAPATPPGMVLVPGGTFLMGRDSSDPYEGPPHEVTLKPFYMDVTEVTNRQYAEFVKATEYKLPSTWEGGTYPTGTADLPVTDVTWGDARAYAQWAKKRLPTEAEWEYAARGTDGRLYPWGKDWTPGLAYTKESGLTKLQPAGSSPSGASPFGIQDLAGNVWEWCEDNFSPYPGSNAQPKDLTFKIIRGGSLGDTKEKAMATYRNWVPPEREYEALGFRCVKSVE